VPTILAIDDKPDNLVTISALLKMALPESTVQTAQSGPEGIARARAVLPDVILLDSVMPGMDGYEVCRRLRADSATRHVPIIMLTALKTDTRSRIKALEMGADAFLTKPIDEGELCAQINVMLRIRRTEEIENLAKFPAENPYPVLRVSETGSVLYANAASSALLRLWACKEGQALPDHWQGIVMKTLAQGRPQKCEANCDGTVYLLTFAPVQAADFVNIYGLDLTDRKRLEREREKLLHDARERIKEMQCMYGVARSIHGGRSVAEILQDVVMLIPSGWRYPETARAKIRFAGREFVSEPFTESQWKQISEIVAQGEVCGSVELYYLEHCAEADEGPFTKEERQLINGIARSLGESIERAHAEDELARSQKHLRMAIDAALVVVWEWDVQADKATWSDNAEAKLGFGPGDFGNDFASYMKWVLPEDRAAINERVAQALQGHDDNYESEYRVVRPNGELRWITAPGRVFRDPSGRPLRIAGTMMDITERKQAEERLLDNQARLKSLASELVLAEERERNRIAVHLHDDVCQNLAYANMKLQMVHAALDDQTQLDDMAEASDTLTRMMQEVRSLTFELSSPVLTEFGLEAALGHWLTEQIEQKHEIATAFTDDGLAKPLADDVRALLFRSVRELLANVVKHSQAQRVEVAISRADNQILIRVEDNGIGFALDQVVVDRDTGGFGLFSIRERLSQLGGSLEIDSSPNQGCRSILRAPLQES